MKRYLIIVLFTSLLSYAGSAQGIMPSTVAKEWFDKGMALKKDQKVQDAIGAFNKAISLQTDYTDALYQLGWCYNEEEMFSNAATALEKCVAVENDFTDALSELGFAYYKLGRSDDALTAYRRAIATDATDFHPVIGIADVYFDNIKNYDSALYYYQAGVKLTSTNEGAFYKIGWCYNDKERFADAIPPLKEAVALDGNYDDARSELGYAYYKQDDYDNALTQFRVVMQHNKKDELSRYYAGFCYYMKNDQPNLKKMIMELRTLKSTKYVEILSKYVK